MNVMLYSDCVHSTEQSLALDKGYVHRILISHVGQENAGQNKLESSGRVGGPPGVPIALILLTVKTQA